MNFPISQSYYGDVWNYKNAVYVTLNSLIENYNWDEKINDTTVLQKFSEHRNSFLKCLYSLNLELKVSICI